MGKEQEAQPDRLQAFKASPCQGGVRSPTGIQSPPLLRGGWGGTWGLTAGWGITSTLRTRLRQKVNLEKDSIRFYPVSRHTLGQVEVLGVGALVTKAPGSVII
ncbi:CRISPR-associated endonuclease Cas2 [Microcoleus sp.]|uniref:CRISPR-associated endonuclease Cas2 n=1 Tax=Microcoleus sp. TaxID=44472 RepID=UPI00352690E6